MKARKLAAIAGAAVMAATALGTATASAAPASVTQQVVAVSSHRSLPKVQTNGMGGSWHRPGWMVRPGGIVFGALYEIHRIRWSHWTNRWAHGQGRLLACAGAAGPCVRSVVTIHLWNVHSHSGPGRYFKDVKYTGTHSLDPISGGHGRSRFLYISGGVWAIRR